MSTTALAFAFDFFISRRGTVAAEAQEVADILQSEGYRVLVQDYDAALGESFPLFIHDALTKARHLLVLHSADYDSTRWTRQEFANFLAAPDARAAERRLCVLRCDAADPRGLLSGVVYGDLHGVTDPAERRRIVLAVARGEAPAARSAPANPSSLSLVSGSTIGQRLDPGVSLDVPTEEFILCRRKTNLASRVLAPQHWTSLTAKKTPMSPTPSELTAVSRIRSAMRSWSAANGEVERPICSPKSATH